MRIVIVFLLVALTATAFVTFFGQNANTTFTTVGQKIGSASPGGFTTHPAATPAVGVADAVVGKAQPVALDLGQAKSDKPRKIRYTADLQVIVEEFASALKNMYTAIREVNGLKAHEEVNSSANTVRTAVLRIRVPEEKLEEFREAVAKLGEVAVNKLDSEDITAQYYDLQAHIENRKAARNAWRAKLDKLGDRDTDQIIKVSDKLDQLTDEINRKEGQLNLWKELTDLTTVTVTLREKQPYVPVKGPELVEVPSFGTRASKTFTDSWEALVKFGEVLALVAIALAPWLPLVLVAVLGIWVIVRLTKSRRPSSETLVEKQEPEAASTPPNPSPA